MFAQHLRSYNIHQHSPSLLSGALQRNDSTSQKNHISGSTFLLLLGGRLLQNLNQAHQHEQRPKILVNGLNLFSASAHRKGGRSHPVLQLRARELSSMCWLRNKINKPKNKPQKKAAECLACFSVGKRELLESGVGMCLE